jgi:hypothetical protein
MLRAGAVRRLGLGLVLAVTAAVGMGGCVLAPYPEPAYAVGPPVVVAPRPVIIGPRWHGYYRGGYHRHGGYYRHWR